MTHTPGPFYAHLQNTDDGFEIRDSDGDQEGLLIAQVFPQRDTKANAALFVASPDLLEAAQLLEKAESQWANCDDERHSDEEPPECCPRCFPYFDRARVARRAAIAKAEGKAGVGS